MSTSRTPKQIFPSEILLLIGTILEREDQKETLSSLVRASRTTWKLLTPLVYRSVNVLFRLSLVGLMSNFGPMSGPNPRPNLYQETRRGLHLLDMIKELTLEAIPKVIKISTLLPPTSEWHELMILTSHHSFLAARHRKRLNRLTITGSALGQLQLAAEMSSQEYDQVSMPSDGLPPSMSDAEFTFLPQSAFSLATLIAFYRPLHLLIQYPLTWYQHPLPDMFAPNGLPNGPPSLDIERPHGGILIDALEKFDGIGATVCTHDVHDQIPPNGHIGARHHVSFVAFPSVPICWEPSMSILPYVFLQFRLIQIKRIINCTNPTLPIVTSCHAEARRPTSLQQWEASKEGTWTFYRAGAMVTDIVPKDEWVHGAGIERRVRAWVKREFVKENGHPQGLADEVNKRLKFVHGGEDEDPGDLICQACGHECRVP